MHILLAIDADETRARRATETVTDIPHAADEVTVTILNVQEEIDITTGDGGSVSSEDWYSEDEFPSSVDTAQQFLEESGIEVQKRREHGDPPVVIMEVADEIDADRIIMCARKRTPVGKVVFGSVTQSVLLNAETPVTIV